MTLPTHIQKAAEEASDKIQADDDTYPKRGPKQSVLYGIQWLYDFLQPELAEKDKWKKCAEEMAEALRDLLERHGYEGTGAWQNEALAKFKAINEPKGGVK